jgi:hypothetical protein
VHLPDGALANPAAAVEQVERGPVLVPESVPVRIVVVEELGESEPVLSRVLRDRFPLALAFELRRVDADRGQAACRVALDDVPDPGNGADAVDSAERPDIEEHDLSPEVLEANGIAHPVGAILGGEFGGLPGPSAVDGRQEDQ